MTRMMKGAHGRLFFFVWSALAVWAAGPPAPRYVIFMIGDGMGWPQVQLAESYLGAQAKTFRAPLRMTSLPVAGIVRTHSANAHVTDSGAGGTALACGVKTENGRVGVQGTNEARFASMAHLAHRHGRKVGIVTTDSIVGATPSAFYAHQPDRWSTYPIGIDLFTSGFDVFVAAGGFDDPHGLAIPTNVVYDLTNTLAAFVEPGNPATNASGITWKHLPSLTASYGYTWIDSSTAFRALRPAPRKLIAILNVPRPINAVSGALTLAELTRTSMALLDNTNGFFLMVEGARMDKAGHQNDAATCLHDMLEFDAAVAAAYEFYTNHPNDTLLVVSADHETGGMTLGHGGNKFRVLARQRGAAGEFQSAFNAYRAAHTTRSRAGRWWASLTAGADAGKARASFDDVKPLLHHHFGFGDRDGDVKLSPFQWQELEQAYRDSMRDKQLYPEDDMFRKMYGGQDPLTITALRMLNEQAGVRWTTLGHSSGDVPVFAAGVGSAWFGGLHDNTEIAAHIMRVMLPGVAFPSPIE